MSDRGGARRGGGGPGGFFGPGRIENPRDFRRAAARLLRYFGSRIGLVVASSLLVLGSVALKTLAPALIGFAIKRYLEGSRSLPGFDREMAEILAIYCGAWVLDIVSGAMMTRLSNGIVFRLRSQVFDHVQTLSMATFDRRGIGDFISRLTNDVEMIYNALSNGFGSLLGGAFSMIGVVVAMLLLNVPLALVVIAVVPLMVLVTAAIGKRIRAAYRRNQEQLAAVTSGIEESVTAFKVVASFHREESQIAKFERINDAARRAGFDAEFASYAFTPAMSAMTSIALALVVGLAGFLALRRSAVYSIGLLTSFVLYSQRFFQPLQQISQVYNLMQSALAGAERLFEVLDTKPEVATRADAVALETVRGDVEFRNVSFGYDSGPSVLEGITFHARSGEMVAIVGPTGAGKTTLVNLLARFYDVGEGSIHVDGHDIRDLDIDGLRKKMGIVPQEPFFFAATIRENLLYGNERATHDEMVEAARMANADYFIRRLPSGYDTELSERGTNLSQGERQLLGIARAILADPRILVLDEATSSVDSLTEASIQKGLGRLMKGRTSFIIAHRLSTVRSADRLLVVHNRRIVEQGTHEELLADPGSFYARLYALQWSSAEVSEDDVAELPSKG